jgi:superfamily II DNA or RNA helicase
MPGRAKNPTARSITRIVRALRRQRTMLEQYALESKNLELLQHDDFTRYCFKMATGSGKTKVMALAVAWRALKVFTKIKLPFMI